MFQIDLREYRLQLWPGYETAIRQHEKDIMLCAEITHKVMRTETVYDILMKCTETAKDYQEEFRKHVLGGYIYIVNYVFYKFQLNIFVYFEGLTVLTDYNNKTYRINDIDFTKNPKKTFNCKEKDVSFMDYYYTVSYISIAKENPINLSIFFLKKYNIRIRDPNQPLLISKAKDREIRGGNSDIIILIPELCRATGLTDNMRSNFQ